MTQKSLESGLMALEAEFRTKKQDLDLSIMQLKQAIEEANAERDKRVSELKRCLIEVDYKISEIKAEWTRKRSELYIAWENQDD